eukprot:NODE_197_length_15379_cov_0.485602.p2 type:complete len:430 gc:universal NODE_197_length_15379_cov_0.485602:15112-13823(-)
MNEANPFETEKGNLTNLIRVEDRNYIMNINLFRKLYVPEEDQQECVWSCSLCYKVLSVEDRWCTKCDKRNPKYDPANPSSLEFIDAEKKTLVCIICGLVGDASKISLHRRSDKGLLKCNVFKMSFIDNVMYFKPSTNYKLYRYSSVESFRDRHGYPILDRLRIGNKSSKSSRKISFSATGNLNTRIPTGVKRLDDAASLSPTPAPSQPSSLASKSRLAVDYPIKALPRKRISDATPSYKKVKLNSVSKAVSKSNDEEAAESRVYSRERLQPDATAVISKIAKHLSPAQLKLPQRYLDLKSDPTISNLQNDLKYNTIVERFEQIHSIQVKQVMILCISLEYFCRESLNKLVEILSQEIKFIQSTFIESKEYCSAIESCVVKKRCGKCIYCSNNNIDYAKLNEMQEYMRIQMVSICNILEAKVLVLQQYNR